MGIVFIIICTQAHTIALCCFDVNWVCETDTNRSIVVIKTVKGRKYQAKTKMKFRILQVSSIVYEFSGYISLDSEKLFDFQLVFHPFTLPNFLDTFRAKCVMEHCDRCKTFIILQYSCGQCCFVLHYIRSITKLNSPQDRTLICTKLLMVCVCCCPAIANRTPLTILAGNYISSQCNTMLFEMKLLLWSNGWVCTYRQALQLNKENWNWLNWNRQRKTFIKWIAIQNIIRIYCPP